MATRKTHARKVFVNSDGTETRSAKPDWETLRFEFLAPEKVDDKFVVAGTFEASRAEIPEDMISCAFGYGLSQKLGDYLAGLEKKAAALADDGQLFTYHIATGWKDLMEHLLDEQWGNILEGVWVTESEGKGGGGGSVPILLQAIQAAYAGSGKPLTDKQVEGIRAKVKTEDGRKAFAEHPQIKVEYLRIQEQRAKDRAAAAAAKASEGGGADLGSLLA